MGKGDKLLQQGLYLSRNDGICVLFLGKQNRIDEASHVVCLCLLLPKCSVSVRTLWTIDLAASHNAQPSLQNDNMFYHNCLTRLVLDWFCFLVNLFLGESFKIKSPQ